MPPIGASEVASATRGRTPIAPVDGLSCQLWRQAVGRFNHSDVAAIASDVDTRSHLPFLEQVLRLTEVHGIPLKPEAQSLFGNQTFPLPTSARSGAAAACRLANELQLTPF